MRRIIENGLNLFLMNITKNESKNFKLKIIMTGILSIFNILQT